MKIKYLTLFLYDLKPFYYNFTTFDSTAQKEKKKSSFQFFFQYRYTSLIFFFYYDLLLTVTTISFLFLGYLQVIFNIQEL